ncbi:aminotransferase class I/II-fold pyridoxal phosphate-dependent enzyme [Bacillus sp. B15-48]|uniref:aminotransferase class I/II-fold pyridoxal phosphate-dependent enzyme n=1 Tax=Bacillus sp. B15-48 TaxID=1548601 RepID=UPI00193F5661|nr:aminotransferase class I/II-fold pyridoxal phosphate-dependent enzyme [Bacillus sp. B15-48]MBM4765336.1 aminotransferase class I/II-fold pyridoxal phosphate-dependent enzyme [Bacillus sp. B15-48]
MNKNQCRTPIYEQLKLHSKKQPFSFHVPGHKNGTIFPEKARNDFQSLLKLDLTEITGLDDLHSPEGVILEAERLLSDLYQTKKSFLLVNGSTAGNLAMILATIKKDEIVLVQRNSHKSIMNGIKLANARPVYLYPEYEQQSLVASGVSLETVRKAIQAYPQARALILTYPNYYGMVNELADIIKLAHAHNFAVLVDEAHGVHFISGEPFPASAVSLGADLVVQSAHKTLPAMTMGAYLHYNSKLVSIENLQFYLQAVQTSSPSYPIMASLDLARSYLATFEKKDKKELLQWIQSFRGEIGTIEGLSILPWKNGDPLKLIIQSTQSVSGYELMERFETVGIYPELADPYNVLFILPFAKADMNVPYEKAVQMLKQAMKNIDKTAVHRQTSVSLPFTTSKVGIPALFNEEMATLRTTFVPIHEAEGQVCAETIIPYPPGVPLFLAGERIQQEELEYLKYLLQQGVKIQGGERLATNEIKVFK